jgi:hypothetical protein
MLQQKYKTSDMINIVDHGKSLPFPSRPYMLHVGIQDQTLRRSGDKPHRFPMGSSQLEGKKRESGPDSTRTCQNQTEKTLLLVRFPVGTLAILTAVRNQMTTSAAAQIVRFGTDGTRSREIHFA